MVRGFCVMLLIVSGASIFFTLSNTPAFSPAAREQTILGGWRIAVNAALYDNATYDFQRGFGYLFADGLVSGNTEARDELASPRLAQERAEEAIAAFQQALQLDPGNAYAWAYLGWAQARIADDEAALNALRASWKIAPNNRILADTRLSLLGTITLPDLKSITLSESDFRAVRRDMETLSLLDKHTLTFHLETLPHLKEMAG